MLAVPAEWKEHKQAVLDSAPPLQPPDGDFLVRACGDVRDITKGVLDAFKTFAKDTLSEFRV